MKRLRSPSGPWPRRNGLARVAVMRVAFLEAVPPARAGVAARDEAAEERVKKLSGAREELKKALKPSKSERKELMAAMKTLEGPPAETFERELKAPGLVRLPAGSYLPRSDDSPEPSHRAKLRQPQSQTVLACAIRLRRAGAPCRTRVAPFASSDVSTRCGRRATAVKRLGFADAS